MKPVAFEYQRPRELAAALDLLSEAAGAAKVMAGAQSLGPMLNLRLAQPRIVVDVRGIAELHEVRETAEEVFLGSCVTHSAIEDGKVPDATRGLMREVAANIAYRAVRNRGTLGGSLCHADPSADWPNVLPLVSAVAVIASPAQRREVAVEALMNGAFSTVLDENEILTGVRIPKLSGNARWGHYKFCRKPGEFAEAVGGVLIDEARGICRAVVGAIEGPPHVLDDARFLLGSFDSVRAMEAIEAAGLREDEYERQIHFVALQRAAMRAASSRATW